MTVIYATATTANGFLATPDNSLDWLFAIEGETPETKPLMEATTALVMGSTTFEWLLSQEDLLNNADLWAEYFGERTTFVFTSRELTAPSGADVRFVSGDVAEAFPSIRTAAGDGTIWVQGGGDLAGQFLGAGLLDEIVLHVAPVFLAAGQPLLPRNVFTDDVELVSAGKIGQFVEVKYQVKR